MRGYFDSLKGQNATRADIAQLLYQIAVHGDTGEVADYGYTDIPATAPYAEAVNALSYAGLFCGCGDNRFEPDAVMTKGQVSVVMARLLGLEPMDGSAEHWALPYLSALQSNGIASGVSAADLNEPISMEELEAMIDRLFMDRQENT